MYKLINRQEFIHAMNDVVPNHFSNAGLNALYDYLEGENDYVADVELGARLDPISFRHDFEEYKSALSAMKDYYCNIEPWETEESALNYLEENTTVIEFDGGIIIQNF